MKASQWRRMTGVVLGDGWRTTGTLSYKLPVGWVLRGILGDRATHTTGFYLNLVRMPLYVPREILVLNWSERFGENQGYCEPDDPKTVTALARAAAQVEIEAESADALPSYAIENITFQEVRGYALLLEGDLSGAEEVLGRVERHKPRYEWEHELVDRAREIRSMIQSGLIDNATEQLHTWREYTMNALGVEPD